MMRSGIGDPATRVVRAVSLQQRLSLTVMGIARLLQGFGSDDQVLLGHDRSPWSLSPPHRNLHQW